MLQGKRGPNKTLKYATALKKKAQDECKHAGTEEKEKEPQRPPLLTRRERAYKTIGWAADQVILPNTKHTTT